MSPVGVLECVYITAVSFEQIKEFLADPSKFVAAAPVAQEQAATDGGGEEKEEKPAEEEEEESDDDMGFGES